MDEKKKRYNRCESWLLFCKSVKKTDKCTTLECSMSSKKEGGSQKGLYTQSVWIDVLCLPNKCNMNPNENYEKKRVLVSGTFFPDEYVQKNGTIVTKLKIWADEATVLTD